MKLEEIGHPVSVYQKLLLIRVFFNIDYIHSPVITSNLSPAMWKHFKDEISYYFINFPSGSSFLIALTAVGEVNIPLTLYFSTSFQYTEAFGVPTIFE